MLTKANLSGDQWRALCRLSQCCDYHTVRLESLYHGVVQVCTSFCDVPRAPVDQVAKSFLWPSARTVLPLPLDPRSANVFRRLAPRQRLLNTDIMPKPSPKAEDKQAQPTSYPSGINPIPLPSIPRAVPPPTQPVQVEIENPEQENVDEKKAQTASATSVVAQSFPTTLKESTLIDIRRRKAAEYHLCAGSANSYFVGIVKVRDQSILKCGG